MALATAEKKAKLVEKKEGIIEQIKKLQIKIKTINAELEDIDNAEAIDLAKQIVKAGKLEDIKRQLVGSQAVVSKSVKSASESEAE
ncbi:hypothetical protein F6V30_14330 [Oryzomonas sagensis]|uniref:Uncharacterized protein n=1 Tax=Oryzomonas sagensis TaxID=2603857 RepID=A0ABQ6TL52_9BACT|nr:hypothetical protein [Oryzomonas sagensis]KAB0669010.1 hypothetical protein F6V30_14330 [Oryzomonas sagensis]